MTRFQAKCKTYDSEVEANRKLMKNFRKIVYVPMWLAVAVGVILAIAIGIVTSSLYCALFLVIALAGVIYMAIMKHNLVPKFKSNNLAIIHKYVEYYKLPDNRLNVKLMSDNKNICRVVNCYGTNGLFAFVDGTNVCFITSVLLNLASLELTSANVQDSFENIIKMDFGKLIIPIDDIDNYRDQEMMVNFKEGVLKLNFSDKKFMDYYISKKDFYFNVNKK